MAIGQPTMIPQHCANCIFFRLDNGGECRHHAPGKYQRTILEPMGRLLVERIIEVQFPPMPPDGWCGDWRGMPANASERGMLLQAPAVLELLAEQREVCAQAVLDVLDDRTSFGRDADLEEAAEHVRLQFPPWELPPEEL